ncbi:50S ribosomal protein L14 [Platysternon megacephalum]|uniref:50S ribosomal protein L14 n=1 Tax=Platysternon megacephalum TaxID=55544 RepID=A0A4D9DP27_9SAUR|nr:50S ribosomal protein L14 [Platysternon megacephalum]
MMGKVVVFLLLALALVTLGASSERKCILSGSWRNELGSNMTISAVNAEGGFTGSYHTAVTATDKRILVSPLKGSQKNRSQRTQPTFGFTVSWTFSNSMTVFVGQCFVDGKGKETLKTMWLLREEVGSPGADWKATRWVTGHRLARSEGAACGAGTAGPGPISVPRAGLGSRLWSKGS